MTLSRTELTPTIQALLAHAMSPDPARQAAQWTAYQADPDRQLWAWTVRGQAVCAAGLMLDAPGQATLLHMGTHPDWRGQGVGRQLVAALMTVFTAEPPAGRRQSTLSAETDDESVGFYRACGFEVEAAPPRFGTPRYRVVRTAG